MKAPEKVIFAFDPDKANIPALTDRAGKILWGCIKTQHIVSQYFNGNVQDVALCIAEKKPKTYEEFKTIILRSGLNIFGTIGNMNLNILDDEFWQGVWEYITGKKELIYQVHVKEQALKEAAHEGR